MAVCRGHRTYIRAYVCNRFLRECARSQTSPLPRCVCWCIDMCGNQFVCGQTWPCHHPTRLQSILHISCDGVISLLQPTRQPQVIPRLLTATASDVSNTRVYGQEGDGAMQKLDHVADEWKSQTWPRRCLEDSSSSIHRELQVSSCVCKLGGYVPRDKR